MSAVLTAEQALKLVGEMFVYHMPFNRALGMELERYEKEFAQLAFKNQPMMVGNWAQSILHGGVIASALDVAAGLVCVGSTLTRHETISEDELRLQKLTLTYAETRRLVWQRGLPSPVALLYWRAAGRVCGRGAPARHGKPPGQPSADGYADGRTTAATSSASAYATLSLVKAPLSIWKAAVSI